LWCYVEQALEQLPPTQRLIVVMAQTFRWSETRIAAYLQAEGEVISPKQVREQLRSSYAQLEAALPDDIRAIYLENHSLNDSPVSVP
ncbi:MAG: sigma-70 family RNA polymerase sigma factor, partial [Leptolyngbyaceae cyanobacterium SM1_3_5]|nr:sigma-70 family RNA polymerase sigma factor [Leptolyngbyaceae cyanobacterium SM1_3_5]